MSESDRPAPPGHLTKRSRDLWSAIVQDYDLEPQELETLTLALDALDTAHNARRTMRREGLIVRDRFGQPKPHPAASINRDAMGSWVRLMGDLGLPTEELPEARQPRVPRRGQYAPKPPKGAHRLREVSNGETA